MKYYDVLITKRAEQDLVEASDYIDLVLKNPIAADKLLDEFEENVSSLSIVPQRNQMIEDIVLGYLEIRWIKVGNYLAFYKIDEEKSRVYILRFLYQKRDWISILHNDVII